MKTNILNSAYAVTAINHSGLPCELLGKGKTRDDARHDLRQNFEETLDTVDVFYAPDLASLEPRTIVTAQTTQAARDAISNGREEGFEWLTFANRLYLALAEERGG